MDEPRAGLKNFFEKNKKTKKIHSNLLDKWLQIQILFIKLLRIVWQSIDELW